MSCTTEPVEHLLNLITNIPLKTVDRRDVIVEKIFCGNLRLHLTGFNCVLYFGHDIVLLAFIFFVHTTGPVIYN